jgi:hypothetical protein
VKKGTKEGRKEGRKKEKAGRSQIVEERKGARY